jgi:hypothetical protein
VGRNTWRWFVYRVNCDGCDFCVESKNGLGLAAQHHDRTGHDVHAEVMGNVSYLSDASHAEELRKKEASS